MLSNRQQRQAKKAAMARKAATPKGDKPAPIVRLNPKPEDRDGLLWLSKKGRLSQAEERGLRAYRAAYREPEAGTIRSNLDDSVGSGTGGFPMDTSASSLDAKRRLFSYRHTCLSGDTQSIELLDAVCGGGLSIPAFLGTSDSRKVLEATTTLKLCGRLIDLLVVDASPQRATA